MVKKIACLALANLFITMGCVTQQQFLASKQDAAMQTALSRGRFELNCPAATGEVLTSEVIQPALQGPYVQGIQRAEFTIGVIGCGQRKEYNVLCPEGGDSCFAAEAGMRPGAGTR